jgi:hypothetical protein
MFYVLLMFVTEHVNGSEMFRRSWGIPKLLGNSPSPGDLKKLQCPGEFPREFPSLGEFHQTWRITQDLENS